MNAITKGAVGLGIALAATLTAHAQSVGTPVAPTQPGLTAPTPPPPRTGPRLANPPNPTAANPTKMANSIKAQLTGKTVGFGFALMKNGAIVKKGAVGSKRGLLDGNVAFKPTTKVNVMSVSKTITAIAILQLMEMHGVEPSDPIGPWLPASWNPGLGFGNNGITFRDLLTHCTGVQQTIEQLDAEDPVFEALSPNEYSGLKYLAEHGIYPQFADIGSGDSYSSCEYKNANFNYGRLLVWQMAVQAGLYTDNHELSAEVNSAAIYQGYVTDYVLEPSGVTTGSCNPIESETKRVLYYDANVYLPPFLYTKGVMRGEGLLGCGAVNWHLSAVDLVKVLGALRYDGLLSNQARTWMNQYKMGWSGGSLGSGRLDHGGLYINDDESVLALAMPNTPWNPTPLPAFYNVNADVRMHSCVMTFTEGLDATLVINSSIRGSSADACSVLKTAYDAAK